MTTETISRERVWRHLAELPVFRALIRSIEHRLLDECRPYARPLLDVGVGDGHFASVAVAPDGDVGIDVNVEMLREARRRRAHPSLVAASATALPFGDGVFATAIANCVIEHIPDLRATLCELHRVLRPGGRLLITVPTDHLERNFGLPHALRAAGLRSIAQAYVAWFRRLQVHHHLLSRAGWLDAITRAGFRVLRARGYLSAAATRRFEIGHYGGWHNLIARRLTGRWVVWPWRPRFARIERKLARFTEEPEHEDDSDLFVVAEKP